MNRMYRKVKDDEYGSEMDYDEPEKEIKVCVSFYWDNYLFEEDYKDDFRSGEYGLSEKIDWDLVSDIAGDVEDCLCGVVADYFSNGKHYCSYYHGSNGFGGDTTDYETWCDESVLYDKLKNFDIPYEDGEIRDEYAEDIYLHLDNSNSDVFYMFGMAVDEKMKAKYTDEASIRIAGLIMHVMEMGADLYIMNPTDRIKELVSQNI